MERAAYAEREPAFPALVFRKEKSTYEQTQRAERRWLQDPGYDVCAPWTERSSCGQARRATVTPTAAMTATDESAINQPLGSARIIHVPRAPKTGW